MQQRLGIKLKVMSLQYMKHVLITGGVGMFLLLGKAAATQSIMYAIFAMHGKNSCLYGQRKGPHKTAYAMYAMLAM